MELALSRAESLFQDEVRDFFASDYPRDILAKLVEGRQLTRADHVRAQQALQSRGWLGVGWPKENGGPGWTPVERYIFEREMERAGAPGIIPMAIIYIGPIICAFGTDEQKRLWLDDILSSRAMWAQGYSEPEAGSDLASLRMSARRDGDDYILDGTKLWTSGAHWADWIFCLVRTSREERRQDGLSLICVPMDAAGVTVEPIISIDGSHELNRVIFDQVRTFVAHRIGEEGKGWHYANVLLASERVSYAHIGRKRRDLATLRAKSAVLPGDFAPTVLDEPWFVARLGALEMEVDVLEVSVLRALTTPLEAAMISSLKIACTETAQKITELGLELAARHGAPRFDHDDTELTDDRLLALRFGVAETRAYLFERSQTIYGGATEIQKNVIWRQTFRRK